MQDEPRQDNGPRQNAANAGRLRSLALHWVPALACMVFITCVSVDPSPWHPGPVLLSDKWEHMLAYAVLCMLMLRAFHQYNGYDLATAAVCALLVATGYGIFNEICQLFVAERYGTPQDALANAIGAALGGAAFIVAIQIMRRRCGEGECSPIAGSPRALTDSDTRTSARGPARKPRTGGEQKLSRQGGNSEKQ